MAKKPKRFATGDEVYSDYGSDEGRGSAGTSEISTKAESTRGAAGTSETVKPKAAPATETSSVRKLSNEEGEAIRKASTTSKPAAPTTSTTTASAPAKKETYKDLSGNIQTKKSTADRDAESAARREKVMDTVRSVGSGIGSMFNKAIENYKSTVPRYNKEKKMAAGGMTASRRGDGIAQRGKTRGKMC
jgi:hypothetical protein